MSMFSYKLPGGLRTNTTVTEEGKIKFDPPVYEQRYTTVVRIIDDPRWKQPLRKIVDFGCAELRLLQLIRRIPFVEHILEVDIDRGLLEVFQQRAIPLISDHLQKREKPLRVEVLEGSLTDAVEQLYDVDVVVAIEVIEHLHADVLEKVPANVFGFIQPKLAIFSTPNSDFNVLFDGLLENGFRHWDHKFEWSRAVFQEWALNICKCYPNYSVAFDGVGKAPSKRKSHQLGFATQIAIFARNDIINRPLNHDIIKYPPINPLVSYRTVYAVDFPYYKDERSKEQKVLDAALYYINQSRYVPRYFNRERSLYQLPLKNILKDRACLGCTEIDLRNVLRANGVQVENEFIILPEFDEPVIGDEDINSDDDQNLKNNVDELLQFTSGQSQSNETNEQEEDWD